jgi:hypothetical protein
MINADDDEEKEIFGRDLNHKWHTAGVVLDLINKLVSRTHPYLHSPGP